MEIKPMNDSIVGSVIVQNPNEELLREFASLSSDVGGSRSYEFDAARSQIESMLSPTKQPHQVTVEAVGPDVREMEIGDIAFLPHGGGTMITVHDEEEGTFKHVFVISERAVLARFPGGT